MYRYEVHTLDGIYKVNTLTDEIFEMHWHRIGAPAYIEYRKDGSIRQVNYFYNNNRHRLDGASHIFYNERGEVVEESWYIVGICYEKEAYEHEIFKRKLEIL